MREVEYTMAQAMVVYTYNSRPPRERPPHTDAAAHRQPGRGAAEHGTGPRTNQAPTNRAPPDEHRQGTH